MERDKVRNLMVRNLVVTDTVTVAGQDLTATLSGSSSAPTVASVAGRTGAVVLTTADVAGLGSAATHAATDFLTSAPVQSVAGRTGAILLAATDVGGLAAVSTSGAYGDLIGKPTIPLVVGGKVAITGTGTVASGLTTITSVVVCLGQDASLAATRATATWSGPTISIKVTRPTSNLDGTPQASTTATVVNWIAFGS